jgi:hypothetical protein
MAQKNVAMYCLFLFFTRSGRPALASVPDTINCRILISEYVHMYIISLRCRHHRGANSCNQHFSLTGDITQGGHSSKYWLSRCCCTSVLENRGNRCFNIVRPLALEFGLLRMVRQPTADAHVIWVARHKVTRPQTILKFQTVIRGGSCNPSYWEVDIWGWSEVGWLRFGL